MSHWVQLTRMDGCDVTRSSPLWVRLETIVAMTPATIGHYPDGKATICTAIYFGGRLQWYVRETPEQILRMMK
jgi:hypothetical protein